MKRYLIPLLLLAATGAAAQQRFDQVERRNPWTGGVNAAGIRQDSLSRSYAAVYFTKTNGGMADPSASDNSWNAGAATASIRHFDKVSFAGSFTYDYFDGRNMCGSMFTRPGYYPVDILEFTPGRKIRETYAFMGGVSAVLGERWTGGLSVDFSAQNYAKRKDLRHKNTRLDFEFSPGIMYHAGPFALGAAYIVGRNSDKLEAEEVGTSPDSYRAFFDRGLRFGSLALWTTNDLHLTTSGVRGFPLKETTQGAGLQVQYGPLYADAAYRNRRGESGENGFIWHEFETSQVTANAVFTRVGPSTEHFVRLHLDWESLRNDENILTNKTKNGVSLPVIHGSLPVFGRKSLFLKGEYEVARQGSRARVGVTHTWLDRESTLMFPYVEGQKMHWFTLYGDYLLTLGRWELNVALDFREGGFSERDNRLDSDLEPGDYPERLTEFYDYENEYLTARRLGVGVGLRRNIARFYIDLSARYEHGFDLRYVAQPNRVAATLSVGYNF